MLASPGDGAVPLRWQASFGATSYAVQRDTSRSGPLPHESSAGTVSLLRAGNVMWKTAPWGLRFSA